MRLAARSSGPDSKVIRAATKLLAMAVILAAFCTFASAQKRKARTLPSRAIGPKVTKIDIEGLKTLLKPDGKPRLINFWATWCDPCREEFPDLVKLDASYKGKIDFITISLDDLRDISRAVPRFLTKMKASMPAYLLSTTDEDAAIALVSSDYRGTLPFTVLLKPAGEIAYSREGKVKLDLVTAEIDKLLVPVK